MSELLAQLARAPVHLGSITLSLEYRRCGKCSRCPHGPYLYARDRTGHRTYLGPLKGHTERSLSLLVRASLIEVAPA
jgi:hypothetical protein